jgi:hypothetical protein
MIEPGPEKRGPSVFFVPVSKGYPHCPPVWVMVSRRCPATSEDFFFHGNGVAEHTAQKHGVVALCVYGSIEAEATGAFEGLFLDKIEPQVNEGLLVEIGVEACHPKILDGYALRAILDA